MEITEEKAKSYLLAQAKSIKQQLFHSEYDLIEENQYSIHSNIVKKIGDFFLARENKKLIINDENSKILRFLTYYFNGSFECENVFSDKNYKTHKNLLILGDYGVGKTLIMKIFENYTNELNLPLKFKNISLTEMLNYYKMNGNLNKFTYNESKDTFEGKPFSVCLNDIGIDTKQKNFGTDLDVLIDEFLYSRYEIYQNKMIRFHLTSNLSVEQFKSKFDNRIVDRLKSFNVLVINGNSKR